ncbi:MAG: cytochrome C, partial [Nitrospirota bacterium]|nr:cytochrome C [Nitrospirota bacterium]
MVFDTDTMRMAAGWTKGGLKLEGGAISGGNDVFPSFVGEAVFTNAAEPGWADADGSFREPRIAEDEAYPPLGPLPKAQAHYEGLYAHGDQVVLRYTVGEDSILEMPALENGVITRTIQGTFSNAAAMVLAKSEGAPEIRVIGADLKPRTVSGRIVLRIPAGSTHFKIAYGRGDVSDQLEDLTSYTRGGPSRFPETVITKGELAKDDGASAYLLDRLTLPYQNPYGMKMRIGGFDFFTSDPSRAAVCTWEGDVWVVSGIDEGFETLKWKRFAAGGHETLGLTIVDDVIYTVGDDQITRYHDLNGDGEADYHENFNNDWELTTSFHEFCFDLQRGPDGDFYFAYGSPVLGGGLSFSRMSRHHGSIVRVSQDGSVMERYATG